MNRATAVCLSLALCGAGHAMAQQPTLYIGGPGGGTQKLFQDRVISAFKAKTGADVELTIISDTGKIR